MGSRNPSSNFFPYIAQATEDQIARKQMKSSVMRFTSDGLFIGVCAGIAYVSKGLIDAFPDKP